MNLTDNLTSTISFLSFLQILEESLLVKNRNDLHPKC